MKLHAIGTRPAGLSRRLLVAILGVALVSPLLAQSVTFINVNYSSNYVQTGAVTVSAAGTSPFVFKGSIELGNGSTSTNPLTAATFTPQGGSASAMGYGIDASNQWTWLDNTQTSQANMLSAYPAGTYTFNLTGTPSGAGSVTVSSFASGPATQLQVPLLTLSGGSWVGNAYTISDTAQLSVSFNNVYTGSLGANDSFHYDLVINGPSYVSGTPQGFLNWDPTTSSSAPTSIATYLTPTLTAGSYTIEVNYDFVQNPATLYGSVFSAALLQNQLNLNLTVVPEPASAVGLAGIAALGLLLLARRRTPPLA